jgi:hypothetical protein
VFIECVISTLQPSRTRLPQWVADVNAVIVSTIETLTVLHGLGIVCRGLICAFVC